MSHAVVSAEWFRVFEWTIGDDELGHPHLHLWIFAPYPPQDLLRVWWSDALRTVGCPLVGDAVVDIREADDDGARELVKYLVKDITSDGEKIPAEPYA